MYISINQKMYIHIYKYKSEKQIYTSINIHPTYFYIQLCLCLPDFQKGLRRVAPGEAGRRRPSPVAGAPGARYGRPRRLGNGGGGGAMLLGCRVTGCKGEEVEKNQWLA